MARTNITELTDDQSIVANTDRVFRPTVAYTPVIPAIMDGKHAVIMAVITNVGLTDAQMNLLETQVGAIAGVSLGHVLIGSIRLPIDRVPDGHDLRLGTKAWLTIEPTPEEPE